MLTVDEALAMVAECVMVCPSVSVPCQEALGMVLAEAVISDVDSPQCDRSVVDGYAVLSTDLASGSAELRVLEEVPAGSLPVHTVSSGTTTRVMTGAPIPPGADAVVMIERAEVLGAGRVRLEQAGVSAGQNILRRAAAMSRGQVILEAGRVLRPADVGLLAEAGQSRVRVIGRPSVAVLATGSELVPADCVPGAGQVRNCNGPMLLAAVREAGGIGLDLGIAADHAETLRERIKAGLECDVLVLSGGVSAGTWDLVPSVLEELGVQRRFHKLRLKPGKPLWFGTLNSEGRSCLVFGLPGNPVSSFVCFELFVRPALAALAGRPNWQRQYYLGRIATAFRHRGDRPTYHPAIAVRTAAPQSAERLVHYDVRPLPWQGSADLRTLSQANALALFPAGERSFEPGDELTLLLLNEHGAHRRPA